MKRTVTTVQPEYDGTWEIYFYGLTGQRLATFGCEYQFDGNGDATQFTCDTEKTNIYFGGKLVKSDGVTVVTDRLGSVRANSNGERFSYFPWGEEHNTPPTADGRQKFGTYLRDPGGLDYADQRYYSNIPGRFLTPDPYLAGAGANDPQSWNRYAYVGDDPINRIDATGQYWCNVSEDPDSDFACFPGLPPIVIFPGGSDIAPKSGPEGTGPWYSDQQRAANVLTLQLMEAAMVAFATMNQERYVDHLVLEYDCITLFNPKTLAASRDRTYQAVDQYGDPIGATVTERVLDSDGGASPYARFPMSSSPTGTFQDQAGLSFADPSGPFKAYQYFVTTIPGVPNWANVPTFVRTSTGDFMVFSIDFSKKMINGELMNDVSYNGDAGMWNADGSPRLPLCDK